MGLLPVQLGVEVGAAREDQGVDRVEDLLHPVVGGRNDHRAATGALDGTHVVVGDQRRLELPRPERRLGDVRSDSDDGPRHFPIVAQPGNGAVNTPCGAAAAGRTLPKQAGRQGAGPPGRKWEEGSKRPLLTRFGGTLDSCCEPP